MSASKLFDCDWLLVEWKSGGRDVVHSRSVLSSYNKDQLRSGDVMTVKWRGEEETAKMVARARERGILDKMIEDPEREEQAGPSMRNEDEDEDFSSSASSWVPSDEHGTQSGDSAEADNKEVQLETYKRLYSNRRGPKKVITPSHRPAPVIPKKMQGSNILVRNRKRAHNDSLDMFRNLTINKSLPDSTRRKPLLQNAPGNKSVNIDTRYFMNVEKYCKILFNTMIVLKLSGFTGSKQSSKKHLPFQVKVERTNQSHYNQTVDEDVMQEEEENSVNEDLNRSDDNVLITNKYSNVAAKIAQNKGADNDEWVPIGSGLTLIPRDKFKRVNWKSYTIATRTLLLAAFPRRILATHSLTGKKSPAFQNKPAKMCLNPKTTSDVIMEIMDRFNVPENLVRSIITTKCADECKMWKTRVNKKKSKKNNENIPPPRPSANNNLEDQNVV